MPVGMILNDEQMDVFNSATKGTKLEITTRGRSITLTRENHETIRELLAKLRDKKFAVKSKTVQHLETCYLADQIIDRIDVLAKEFKPIENDNETLVVVDNTETVEESAVEVETEEDSGSTDNGSQG